MNLISKITEDRKSFFLIGAFSLAILALGLTTHPCLGDEMPHYRMAKGFFQTHHRVAIDSVYEKTHLIYFYNSEPLWPALLGWLWMAMGRVSTVAAQIYQAFYYLSFLILAYLLSKRLFDPKQALLSVLLLATAPMIAAFGTLFYVAIPMMSFLMLSVLFFIKKKIFRASLAMSAAFLTKITALFFLPAFLWCILKSQNSFKEKIKEVTVFLLPLVMTIGADAIWRKIHLSIPYLFSDIKEAIPRQTAWQAIKDRIFLRDVFQRLSEYESSRVWEYTNSSLWNITDIFKYFGVVLVVLGAVFLFKKKPQNQSQKLCSAFILSYLAGFAYTCLMAPDVRYLLPVVPFLAILLSAVAAEYWQKSWGKFVILGLCFLQFGGTAAYVFKERRISPAIQEGFAFIRQKVPENTLTIYPESIFIEKTDRGLIWAHRFRHRLTSLFWDADKKPIIQYLISRHIQYLALKKNRIYDDSKHRHFGGYPRSFAEQMESSPYFKKVFENKEISIWHIQAPS